MHFPHDNQGQDVTKRAAAAHSFYLGRKQTLQEMLSNSLEVSKKRQFQTEGSAPGYEAPTLLKQFWKTGKNSIHVVDFSGT